MTVTRLAGTFGQRPDSRITVLRERRLGYAAGLGYPAPPDEPVDADLPLGDLVALVRQQLVVAGMAAVRLSRPLSTQRFREFGELLGRPQPERSPDVVEFVEDAVVLNLITRYANTADPARAPFAANWLSLHTESSGAPADRQPRYIVLMCREPGPPGGRTVLVPMADVHAALPAWTRAILTRTRYRTASGDEPPPILRYDGATAVFSCRDFVDAELDWVYEGTSAEASTADDVNSAFELLYATVYAQAPIAFEWHAGLLGVIDNQRHFHGRTAGAAPVSSRPRHLQRLRVAVE